MDSEDSTDDLTEAELAAMLTHRPELKRLTARLGMLPPGLLDSVTQVVDRLIDHELTGR